MDNQRVTLLMLLDSSSAFDTVDHEAVLLRRLQITFGIADTTLQRFGSYLAGRSQLVLLNGSFSENFSLLHGVPKDSCLGPLLFTIYASKLFEVVKCHLPDVYADDTQHTNTAYAIDNQLYISFKPGSSASELEAVTALQDCILHIKTWMTADKLKLNNDKTINCNRNPWNQIKVLHIMPALFSGLNVRKKNQAFYRNNSDKRFGWWSGACYYTLWP